MITMKLESYDSGNGNERGRINHSRDTPSNLTIPTNGIKSSDYSRNSEGLSLESMSYCSRFEDCSAPKCPLDLLISFRFEDPDDPKCEMAKATRHKYWLSMNAELRSLLPFRGYLESEYNRIRSARERWESMPEEKKRAITERLKGRRQHDQ